MLVLSVLMMQLPILVGADADGFYDGFAGGLWAVLVFYRRVLRLEIYLTMLRHSMHSPQTTMLVQQEDF